MSMAEWRSANIVANLGRLGRKAFCFITATIFVVTALHSALCLLKILPLPYLEMEFSQDKYQLHGWIPQILLLLIFGTLYYIPPKDSRIEGLERYHRNFSLDPADLAGVFSYEHRVLRATYLDLCNEISALEERFPSLQKSANPYLNDCITLTPSTGDAIIEMKRRIKCLEEGSKQSHRLLSKRQDLVSDFDRRIRRGIDIVEQMREVASKITPLDEPSRMKLLALAIELERALPEIAERAHETASAPHVSPDNTATPSAETINVQAEARRAAE